MSKSLRVFLDLNKPIITSIYEFSCSSGDKMIYILMNEYQCERIELLNKAEEEEDGELDIYLIPTHEGTEHAIRECINGFTEI